MIWKLFGNYWKFWHVMDPEQLTTLSVPSADPQNQSDNHNTVFLGWTKSRILGPKKLDKKICGRCGRISNTSTSIILTYLMSPWCVMMPKNCGLTYRQPNSLVDVYIFNCCQRLLHQCWPHYGWAWLVTLFCHINKRWSRDVHCTHWLRSHFHKEFTLIAFIPLPLLCCILKPSSVKIL